VETTFKNVAIDDGEYIQKETRGFVNIDELIYLCTTQEISPQKYDDFMLTNYHLARGVKDSSAIVFEVICSLYGLLERPINYSRAKFFINYIETENNAISVLRSFIKPRQDLLLMHLPLLLVDLVLEYEFSILTKKTPIWPGKRNNKNVCIAIKRGHYSSPQ